MGIIYKATNIVNNKIYIGQTTQNIAQRKAEHVYRSKTAKTGFDSAIRKYGVENFTWEAIEENIERNLLDNREQYWIDFFDSYKNGYNLTTGGFSSKVRPFSKKTVSYSMITGEVQFFPSMAEAARTIGTYSNSVKDICKWTYISAKDHLFFYEEEYNQENLEKKKFLYYNRKRRKNKLGLN